MLSALGNFWVLGCRQRLIHEFACWTICLNNNSLAASLVSSIAAVVALVSPAAKEINLATAAAADPRLNSRRKEQREKGIRQRNVSRGPFVERERGVGKTALPFISKPVDH